MYCADLRRIVDRNKPFSMKDIPKTHKDDIKKCCTLGYYPKKFKYKNETGIFEAAIYLNDHYKVVIHALIISKDYIIVDSKGIMIQNNGVVCYYQEDFSLKRKIKTKTGFILDEDKKTEILDFIEEMKNFSAHLRNKYYKEKTK